MHNTDVTLYTILSLFFGFNPEFKMTDINELSFT